MTVIRLICLCYNMQHWTEIERSVFQKLCTPSHRHTLFLHTIFFIKGFAEDKSSPDT